MKNKIKFIGVFLAAFIANETLAQTLLTKEEAILQTLENNFDIVLSKNALETAENNASIYNSGYLPTIFTDAGASLNNRDITRTFPDDPSRDSGGKGVAQNYNASIGLNYVLFNGMGRYYTHKKLKETYHLTELQARGVMENTLLTLFAAYYEVARLSENVRNQQETLKISKERLKRAAFGEDYGQSTKLDVLNAQVDLNNDSISYLNSTRELENAKRDLNIVLGREVTIDIKVDTTIAYNEFITLEGVLASTYANNTEYLQAQKSIELGEYDSKISQSTWMPTVSLTSSYAWTRSQDPASIIGTAMESNSNALNGGLSMKWNLFDGGSTRTKAKNAKIAMDRLETQKDQKSEQLKKDVYNAWESYQNALFTLKVQKTNLATNKLNFERSAEYYKLGQINSIDFRQAQVNLINAELVYSLAKYTAKNAELLLLQLSGGIIGNKLF